MKKLLLFILCGAGSLSMMAQPCAPNTNSLFFNGSSAYVSIANQTGLDITDSITVEAWVNATAFGITSAQNSIVCKHGWSQGEAGYVLRLGGSGQLSFNLAGLDINGIPVSWVDNVSPTATLTTATWYHVAGTFDGNNSKIYVNGVLKGTVPFTGTIVSSPYPLNIGHLSDPGQPADRFFNGYIDEVKIWNRALSQAELQANMNVQMDTSVAHTGLVSYWRMNNGTGATVTDLSTGGHNGATSGTTWSTTVPFNNAPTPPAIVFSSGNLVSNSPTNNQWYLNGVAIAGATNQIYHPTVIGSYYVVVTNTAGCTAASNPYNVTTVGVQDLNNLFAVNTYVVNNQVVFDIESAAAKQNVNITITDISGKTVQLVTGKNLQAGKNKIVVDSPVSKGIYLYEINGSNVPVAKGKFVFN